ncbi:MAG: 4Fe-4S binding protein [Firmicutes bacterium]|nr:4Fe-4S binding protein [Bacillota bacterium]
MVYKISDECISCGVCVEECPAEAISEGADKYEIDPEKCTSCGNCSEICPVGAPQEEE